MKEPKQAFLKPASMRNRPGLCTVRDPETRKQLAAEGELKPLNTYWLRRLNMHDVVEAKPPTKSKARKGEDQ